MTGVVEIGYLTHITLLDKKIVAQADAIRGCWLVDLIRREAPLYVNHIGGMFGHYMLMTLGGSLNFNDTEATRTLQEKGDLVMMVCDSAIDPMNTKTILNARYWLFNGENGGLPFYYGTAEEEIMLLNEKRPLREVISLADVKNDDDFWGFVNTWLEKNWRIGESIHRK